MRREEIIIFIGAFIGAIKSVFDKRKSIRENKAASIADIMFSMAFGIFVGLEVSVSWSVFVSGLAGLISAALSIDVLIYIKHASKKYFDKKLNLYKDKSKENNSNENKSTK